MDEQIDVALFTETWLKGDDSDQKVIGDVTPIGFRFCQNARTTKRGGGIGILHGDSIRLERHRKFKAKSFESSQITLSVGGHSVKKLQSIAYTRPKRTG